MRLRTLSSNPNKPCFVLQMQHTTIMLDCGLDTRSLLHFLPIPPVPSAINGSVSQRLASLPTVDLSQDVDCKALKQVYSPRDAIPQIYVNATPEFCLPNTRLIDLSQIDVLLISNHTAMLALPYITERTGFSGRIYVTDPTLQLGRLVMQELSEYMQRLQRDKSTDTDCWKSDAVRRAMPECAFRDLARPSQWARLYEEKDIEAALSRVELVAYNERIKVMEMIKVVPVSSGSYIGSCNWIIETAFERICYLAASSQLTTHPKAMDISRMKRADTIMTALTQTPLVHPDQMMGEFCAAVSGTLRDGGSVLVPCLPTGLIYDLLECLRTAGIQQVPMYFVSPSAEASLAYANIFAEWLSDSKMAKVFEPDEPFPHAKLIQMNVLRHYTSLASGLSTDFTTPCIVFAGHASLRFGDAVHFLHLFDADERNCVILVEPDFATPDVLAPFSPLRLRVRYCPIDTNIDFAQANKLLRDVIKPSKLYLHDVYTRSSLSERPDLKVQFDPTISLRPMQPISIAVTRRVEQLKISSQLAAGIELKDTNGKLVAPISGILSAHNYCYRLRGLGEQEDTFGSRKARTEHSASSSVFLPHKIWPSHCGTLDTDGFVCALKAQGFSNEIELDGQTVKLGSVVIKFNTNATHIDCIVDDFEIAERVITAVSNCLYKI